MTTLQTFRLPDTVGGTESDIRLARDLVRAWQTDGIFQVATDPAQDRVTADAIAASRRFFRLPMDVKAGHVSDLTYSGYIASGEEVTAGEADYSEIFTVCKDVALDDPRVRERWPCHGPVPWPDPEYAAADAGVHGPARRDRREAAAAGRTGPGPGRPRRVDPADPRRLAPHAGAALPGAVRRRPPAASARTPTTGCWSSPPRTTSAACSSARRSRASGATATGWSRRARPACTRTTSRGRTSRRSPAS